MGVKFDTVHPHPNPPPKWGGNYFSVQARRSELNLINAQFIKQSSIRRRIWVACGE